MPRLPVIKVQRLIKVLRRLGFFEWHRVGSHIQFKHFDGRRTTVSAHYGKDVPNGTLRAIIGDINISVGEFIEKLKK